MNTSRRDWLRLGAVGGMAGWCAGCSSIIQRFTAPSVQGSAGLPEGPLDPVVRLVNRVSFGAVPGDIARVKEMGTRAYLREQLKADGEEPLVLRVRRRAVDALHSNALEMRDLQEHEILRQLQQAALLSAVYSRHQLRERMVDLWSNHFNIYARKGYGSYYKATDEQKVIREHALGKFPDLLKASARSPAMLSYLDNQVNRKGTPNENYARELMELHTLGVHGGYSQKDVQEVARCLTGWTVEDRFLKRRGTFRFDETLHDRGPKTVLGRRIPAGGGISDGDAVLEMLVKHPSTAKFIAGKVSRYFLGRDDAGWTSRLGTVYLRTDGDIKAMLEPLLLSQDLLRSAPLLKRPFDFLVSALRALGADSDCSTNLQRHLESMGQPLYQWPMPDGYPDTTTAWTGSLLARWNFAFALTRGAIEGTSVSLKALAPSTRSDLPSGLLETITSRRAESPEMRPLLSTMREYLSARGASADRMPQIAALCIASPQFQWR